MVRKGRLLLGAALVLVVMLVGIAGAAAAPQSRVVFYAPFTTAPSAAKWNIEDTSSAGGYRACCLGYGLQTYQPSQVYAGHGVLTLAADANPYRSGALTTQGKFSFRYGRLDIRAKLPKGPGLWPAFWLLSLPVQTSGYQTYEIDLMEELGADPHTVYFTVHQGGNLKQGCTIHGPDFSAGYHVYTLIWSAGKARFLLDGVQRCVVTHYVSNESMYLLMNNAIGTSGLWGGGPTAATHFPQSLDIDYVRVSQ